MSAISFADHADGLTRTTSERLRFCCDDERISVITALSDFTKKFLIMYGSTFWRIVIEQGTIAVPSSVFDTVARCSYAASVKRTCPYNVIAPRRVLLLILRLISARISTAFPEESLEAVGTTVASWPGSMIPSEPDESV